MLYLLRSHGEGDVSVLKLGYASDYSKRLLQYQSHNPYIKEVGKREGSVLDEVKFHLYLHFLGYGILKDEWYKDCQEVIDIFNNASIDSIDSILWSSRDKVFSDKYFVVCKKSLAIYEELSNKFGFTEKFEIDNIYLKKKDKQRTKQVLEDIKSLDSKGLKASEICIKEFYSLDSFIKRMRFLCEEVTLSKEDLDEVLQLVPHQYKNYYETLGPARLKACGYNVTRVKKEFDSSLVDPVKIKERILEEFNIGGKYSKSDIKQKLSDLYSSLGYNKTPKATDLEEYFEIKPCLISNKETGKRDHGFEIVKKK